MADQRYKDKEWLKEKYHDELMSQEEIGELCGVTQATIHNWMEKFDIEIRDGVQRFPHASFGMSRGYERAKGDWRIDGSVHIHRLAAVAWFGWDELKGKVVHHKNKIPFDNREENLEPVTPEKHNTIHHKNKDINDAQKRALENGQNHPTSQWD